MVSQKHPFYSQKGGTACSAQPMRCRPGSSSSSTWTEGWGGVSQRPDECPRDMGEQDLHSSPHPSALFPHAARSLAVLLYHNNLSGLGDGFPHLFYVISAVLSSS